MELHGKNFVGQKLSSLSGKTFSAINPASGDRLLPDFFEASSDEIKKAGWLAQKAFEIYRKKSFAQIARFLEKIAEEILALGDELIERASLETALPATRLVGERTRTLNQIKMFAEMLQDGSWVDASIDQANADRKPLPKPDLRRMLIPIGPVAVFGASNFPLAYSVAGGDTIAALAAGNPVVVKGHPAHPGTSELTAAAILRAAAAEGMPEGIFSLLHGKDHEVSLQLVRHEEIKAVGFTGSLKGGRALFDAAAARAEPIPVYAEMGSTNPIFILSGALEKNADSIAEGLVQSVTLGVGQFCTNPGLVVAKGQPALDAFLEKAGRAAATVSPGTMLNPVICERFEERSQAFQKIPGVRLIGKSEKTEPSRAAALVFVTNAKTFFQNEILRDEMFGPSTLVIACDSDGQLEEIAREMQGQLTATLFATEADLAAHRDLIDLLGQKAGRLLFNSFPTGVEVCPSMHHGGPYPATTDARSTSVGIASIKRFARPICFQNFPEAALPEQLRNKNSRQIWRLIDNQLSKMDIETPRASKI